MNERNRDYRSNCLRSSTPVERLLVGSTSTGGRWGRVVCLMISRAQERDPGASISKDPSERDDSLVAVE